MKTLIIALVIASASYTAFAQTDTTGTPGRAVSAPTQARSDVSATQANPNAGLTVSGYVEAYYSHDFTLNKTTPERPGFLYNHRRNREVNINLAFIKAAYTGERVRGNLAIQVGNYAQYNYAAEQELTRNIFEANAGVKLAKNRDLWLDAGIFVSHIGFESAISKDCWTLTRSMLAENSPYYLSGAKVTYNTPDGKLTVLGMVTNGWQRVRKLDGYSGPSFSTQVQYRPSPMLTLNWSSFLGSDRPDSLRQGRFFNNLYAIINPAGRFGVILGFDVGTEQKPFVRQAGERIAGYNSWFSPVAIARYKTSEKSYVNARVEYYDDKRGIIIGIPGFQTMGYSLGYDYAIMPNALFRVEGKMYDSKSPIFEAKRVNTSLTTSLAVSF